MPVSMSAADGKLATLLTVAEAVLSSTGARGTFMISHCKAGRGAVWSVGRHQLAKQELQSSLAQRQRVCTWLFMSRVTHWLS